MEGERLKGAITLAKAIKGNGSVHTSRPGHKDICLFGTVCEALTKLVPVVNDCVFSASASWHRRVAASVSSYRYEDPARLSPHRCSFVQAIMSGDKPHCVKYLSSFPGGSR